MAARGQASGAGAKTGALLIAAGAGIAGMSFSCQHRPPSVLPSFLLAPRLRVLACSCSRGILHADMSRTHRCFEGTSIFGHSGGRSLEPTSPDDVARCGPVVSFILMADIGF